MYICEISNICGYILFEHRLHRFNGLSRLRSWLTSVRSRTSVFYIFEHRLQRFKGLYRLRSCISVRSQISVVFIFEHRLHRFEGFSRLRLRLTSVRSRISVVLFLANTDYTDLRDLPACARDLHLWDLKYLWLFIFEHRLHRSNGLSRLRSWLTSVRSRISVVIFYSNTDCTDLRDILAYARDGHLWDPEYLWF